MTQRPSPRHRLARYFVYLSLLAFFAGPAQATIDTAVNTTVWKLLYGLTAARVNDLNWLAADDDSDGLATVLNWLREKIQNRAMYINFENN